MLDRYEILDVVATLKVGDHIDSLTLPERNDELSKLLGFFDFSELQAVLLSSPVSTFRELSIFLMKKICLIRKPGNDVAYYEFHKDANSKFSCYSMWSESEEGAAVRVPRPLNGPKTIERLRGVKEEIFVLESVGELMLWSSYWRSRALVNQKVAELVLG